MSTSRPNKLNIPMSFITLYYGDAILIETFISFPWKWRTNRRNNR